MSRAGLALLVLLIAAACAAFPAARAVRTPARVVEATTVTPHRFSPNGDGRRETTRVTVRLRHGQTVTLAVVDRRGAAVRTLARDRYVGVSDTLRAAWDGRDEDGDPAPDGRYRLRVTLGDQGRSTIAARAIVRDTRPPRPLVRSIGPVRGPGPELLPGRSGAPATVRFAPAGAAAQVLVFRTAPGAPAEVLRAPLARGATSWRWDGTVEGGAPAPPGTYLVALRWRDRAGTMGTSVPLDRRGLPVLDRGRLPGRGGVTVRHLAAQPPVAPVREGDWLTLFLDARSKPFRWDLRRLGRGRPARAGGPKTDPRIALRAPAEGSAVYLFEVRSGGRLVQVPVPVTSRRREPVLVVLPTISWQGRNPVDDDGDGAPDTLDLGGPARLARLSAGGGLPLGFTDREAPLLVWLDRTRRRYELTTDAALLLGRGPRLEGHRGVLLAGDERWLPARLQRALRDVARRGGTVASLGVDSLRRTVELDARGRLFGPSPPAEADAFGARLRPVVRRFTNLEIFEDDRIALFRGGPGLLRGVPAWEETTDVGPGADLLASAVTAEPVGRTVVVGARFGRGLVLRPGFPTFARRLSGDPATAALMAQMWRLLSR